MAGREGFLLGVVFLVVGVGVGGADLFFLGAGPDLVFFCSAASRRESRVCRGALLLLLLLLEGVAPDLVLVSVASFCDSLVGMREGLDVVGFFLVRAFFVVGDISAKS